MLRRDEVVLHVVDQFGVDVYGVIRGHALNARAQVRRQSGEGRTSFAFAGIVSSRVKLSPPQYSASRSSDEREATWMPKPIANNDKNASSIALCSHLSRQIMKGAQSSVLTIARNGKRWSCLRLCPILHLYKRLRIHHYSIRFSNTDARTPKDMLPLHSVIHNPIILIINKNPRAHSCLPFLVSLRRCVYSQAERSVKCGFPELLARSNVRARGEGRTARSSEEEGKYRVEAM